RTRHSLADVKAARSRTSTSSGTLLSTMANLPKAKPGITLPTSPPSKCTTVDSDLSTTDATSRSQDYDSDGFAEENLPSPMLSPSHQERVIILDWDDTLMPTSFLRDALKIYPSCRYIPSSRTGLRKKTRSATSGLPCQAGLEAHCTLVRELLIAARSVAHVAIVTLAERPWVVDSAEQYMPSLNLPRLLRDLGIPVYYAVEYRKPSRNPLVPETPPACSKRLAMEDFILSLSRDFGSRFNLLSIGDSMAEREAARKASAALEKKASKAGEPLPYCKTVKLQTDPSLKMLTLELQAMLSNMDRLLAMNHDLDLIFEQQDSIEDIEEKVIEAVGL
ncbi:unnamed protein product, partial [Effrenium voratum]